MGFYLDNAGNYYEGDKADIGHQAVPQRPSYRHKFVNNEWVLDQVVVDEETRLETLKKLDEIDLKSIRSMREWIAAQPSAPQFIKDHEAEAIAERTKLDAVCAKIDGEVDGEVLINS